MKKLLLAIAAFCLLPVAYCQLNYWQQEVNYVIDVTLNDKEHTLDGFEKIEYINHSPDTLRFIWFHLWPNAYKNDRTAYSDHLLENGNTSFYFSEKEQRGYINRMDFKVNNITAEIQDHPEHIDIIKLILPQPLLPNQRVTISTPFHVKLPYNFSRGGHDGQSYQATQWYPKPAVYDKQGWHPMPYLDQGEYYSEFGSFDVRITVPSNYVVAATGELQNEDERAWLQTRRDFDWKPPGKESQFPESATNAKTLRFKQSRIHDFAWFADKRFIVNSDTCRLPSGRVIDVFSHYTPAEQETWKNSVQYAKDAVRFYSEQIGEYPFNTVSVVQGPQSFGGGMEYPTITIISPTQSKRSLENTIAHEIGHNWFYGILASNERDHPWMDEGVNSFYDAKYAASKYGVHATAERVLFETKATTRRDQPISTSSQDFSEDNYYLTAYFKSAEWMRLLETRLGPEVFKTAMQEYFRRWQFRHPQPEDFKNVIQEASGKDLTDEFALLDKHGVLPNQQRSGTKVWLLFQPKKLNEYLSSSSKELITVGPALGANSYDKIMLGVFVSNVKLPPSPFQYFLAPMYATGSKKMTGIGFLQYNVYPQGVFRRVKLALNAATFSQDEFIDGNGQKTVLGFRKIVPELKLFLREKNPRSTMHRHIQFKSFLINEEGLRFFRDTVINPGPPPDTAVTIRHRTTSTNHTLNQLRLVIENSRSLYPYKGDLNLEQGTDFIRAGFTGNYFFNYPSGGGLNVRVFAGKFIYTSSKTSTKQFATERFHLNLTGPNGYEDYTYSDYFPGRNEFEGFASQQIMLRDGAFKIRTDLLASKIGKTDDWMLAVNLTSTIPAAINPLSLLPFKLPVKLFFDFGTQRAGWDADAEEDRFLFDGGLYFSFIKETVKLYVPLVYSNVFKEYLQSTLSKKERFWKKISFSIDISNFSLRNIDRRLVF